MPRRKATAKGSGSEGKDPVISALEYGMEQLKKLCKDMLPLCNPEERREKAEIFTEKFKRLVQAQMVCEESSRIVENLANELEGEYPDLDVWESCKHLQDESDRRVEEFKSKITEEMIVTNKAFASFAKELKSILLEEAETEREDGSEEEKAALPKTAPKSKGRKKRGKKRAVEPQSVDMESDETVEAMEVDST